jgi:hypothetical protein
VTKPTGETVIIITYNITMSVGLDKAESVETLARAFSNAAKVVVDVGGVEHWTDSWDVHRQLVLHAPPLPKVKP